MVLYGLVKSASQAFNFPPFFVELGIENKRTRQTYTRYQTLELEKEFHFNK